MFEVANDGTLFLDELGELDKNIQVKLLRFLESGELRPIGANESVMANVRVIAATNRELKQMVAEGDFREDLLYRLNMFHIHIPPLRERKADIPDLARHLLARAAKRPLESVAELLTAEALDVMMDYHWKGNVRELANAMEYAWIVAAGEAIKAQHLPYDVRSAEPTTHHEPSTISMSAPAPASNTGNAKTLSDVEMDYILQVYAKNNQNKQVTAAELGISLKTLYNKLHKYEEELRLRTA